MIALIPTLLTVWIIAAAVFLVISFRKPRPRAICPCRRRTDAPAAVPSLLQEQAD